MPSYTFDDALARLLAAAKPKGETQTLPLLDVDRRILANDVSSEVNSPIFDNSAMDGYALNLAEIYDLSESIPVAQRIVAGKIGTPLAPNTAARIFTGAKVPYGTNAIVPQEAVELRHNKITLKAPVHKGQHIRHAGEDYKKGSLIIQAGTSLTPRHLALAASAGLAELTVRARLAVGVIFTGNELTEPGQSLSPGNIYNSNRYAIVSLLNRLGFIVNDYGNISDSLSATIAALNVASNENDVIISVGGVSVGEEDYVKAAVLTHGHLELWNIAMKPGKPFAFGRTGSADFIGLPGNPVSAFLTFCLLARPFLLARMGARNTRLSGMMLPADFSRPIPCDRREFLRASLIFDQAGRPKATLCHNQGSAAMCSLVSADGLVDIPAFTTVNPGDLVRFVSLDQLTG